MAGLTAGVTLHASCVALQGRALLIVGRSGSGKSSLALSLMAFGAQLISDDRTCLKRDNGAVLASAPPTIQGLIEARGVGLLRAEPAPVAPVVGVVDLDRSESERLPPYRETDLLGQSVTLFLNVDAPHFAPALIQFLKAGRRSP